MSKRKTPALKACPTCGSQNVDFVEYKPNRSGACLCGDCGTRSGIAKNDHIDGWKAKAAKLWNRRPQSQSDNELRIKFLEQQLEATERKAAPKAGKHSTEEDFDEDTKDALIRQQRNHIFELSDLCCDMFSVLHVPNEDTATKLTERAVKLGVDV